VLDTIVLKTHKQLLFVYFIPRVWIYEQWY
jgi:hypothetical protein